MSFYRPGRAGGGRYIPPVPRRGDRPARRPVPVVAVVAVLTLLTFRGVSFHPVAGLDPSWQAALHMAAHRGVPFGDNLAFSFGPLGFLTEPVAYYGVTGALSGLFVVGLEAALCAAVLSVLRRSVGLAAAAVVTFVVATAAGLQLKPAEVVVVVAVVVAFGLLRGDHSPRTETLLVVAGGVLAGTSLLVKFNTGVTVTGVAVLTAWFVGRRTWRSEAVLVVSTGGSMLLGWVATGNRLGDLGAYVRLSVDVASGYSESMGIEAHDRVREYAVAAVVVLVLVGLAWVASRSWPRARRIGLGLVGLLWLYAALKHGFVRHDEHDIVFFGESMLIGVAVAGSFAGRGRLASGVPVVAGLVLLLAYVHADGARLVDVVNPWPSLRTAGQDARYALSPGRRAAAETEARARLRASYGLDPATLAVLAGQTVHVRPWEAQVAWAYPELHWRPVPVFQEYSAYTPALDRLDADFLSGPTAPQRILTEDTTIDFRNPDWESPEAMVAMACHYRQLVAQPRWQVLGRVPDRCGEAQPLGVVRARVGETVAVPDTPGRDVLVVARIRGLDDSPLYGLRSSLLRIPEVHVALDGGRRYRLVPGTAADGLLVRAPADPAIAGFDQPFAPDSTTTLRVEGGGWGLGSTLEVEFTAIPLDGSA